MLVPRISWKKAISIAVANIIFGYIIFLMLEVLMGDALAFILNSWYSVSYYTIIFFILLIGFGLSVLISVIIFIILIKGTKKLQATKLQILKVITYSIIFDIIIIFIISIYYVEVTFPDIFGKYNLFEKIIILLQYIDFYAVYVLESPVVIWDMNVIIYGILLIVFMKIYIHEYNPKKKIKQVFNPVV